MIDTDIHTYFKQHKKRAAKKAGAASVWLRSADTLARGGVKTMGDLAKINNCTDFIRYFIDFEGSGRKFDEDGFDFAGKMRAKYFHDTHKEKLLAAGEILVEAYFCAHGPRDAPKGTVARAAASKQWAISRK